MGNTNTKESRYPEFDGYADNRERRTELTNAMGLARGMIAESSSSSRQQASRGDRPFLNLGPTPSARNRDRSDAPFEHRETKQEREARKLERERAQRAQDRERSLREEHVDGGFLVTLGTYTGTEDFSKPVVRQLQIERKVAPFWRGLNDWSSSWTELQLIAAARALPIPAADAPPGPELAPRLPQPLFDSASGQNLNNLTVEMGPRTLSTASDNGPNAAQSIKSSIKPRARALAAALSVGSRNASSTDLTPREIFHPYDPFVNGQPIEVFLYKNTTECPICFLTYPPYLNHTRCCDQPICTECFVQIKRADPHLPEHHPDGQVRDPNQGLQPEDPPEMLISEPASCPYCQQPEFGVTYDPPPFRRGLTLTTPSTIPGQGTATSSQTSLNATLTPGSATPTGRRRARSLSANAPNVITTDRIRPDWSTKLATVRSQQARRAAAATALHTAAFLIGGNDTRSRNRSGRFGRRNTGSTSGGTNTPQRTLPGSNLIDGASTPTERGPGARATEGNRRSRMEELEDVMFMEAVRLSLATEEERKRKEEKAARKEAKKREKEEAKAAKKQGKGPYEGGALSGGSRSSLSLVLSRKRNSSMGSNLRTEASAQGTSQAPTVVENQAEGARAGGGNDGKGKGVDRGAQEQMTETTIPTVIEP